jgi:3-dehydroquinate dehydratase-2
MPRSIAVLNGPNLNLLGVREPEIYGHATLADVEALCRARAKAHGLDVAFDQSNHEGVIVELIQDARRSAAGIVINPAGFTSTSIAVLDALKMFDGPIVEVHISNIHKREAFRHRSFVSYAATGVICGLGVHGYALAIDALAEMLGPDGAR